jgi:hypothetical protein
LPYYSKEDNEEISKVASYLDPDERVVIVAKGSEIMFLTNKRLLMRKLSILKRETIQDISYDKIISIQLKKGFRSSKILLFISGYKIEIDSIKKEVAERVLEYLKEVTHKSKINDVIDSDDVTTRSNIDSDDVTTRSNIDSTEDSDTITFSIANELEKLSKLKNKNVISEKEFQMMKNKLFKKMDE